jgi:hypothetical protein
MKEGISRSINGKREWPLYSSPRLRVKQFFRVDHQCRMRFAYPAYNLLLLFCLLSSENLHFPFGANYKKMGFRACHSNVQPMAP